MAKILTSNNYGRFVLSPFNRNVRKTRWLRESLLKWGWITSRPLDVRRLENGKLEIISGHKRFFVAQKLGVHVKYVEDNTTPIGPHHDVMHDVERGVTPWNLKDWLVSHIRTGKKDYVAVQEYHRRTGIGLSQCISLRRTWLMNFRFHQFSVSLCESYLRFFLFR